MNATCKPPVYKAPRARSRVTNGRSLFVTGKQTSAWARRYRDLAILFAEDAGGAATLSELKLGLIRRAAALAIECERMEGILAQGGAVDIDLLARTSSHLRRIAETIGLDRRQGRDMSPDINDLVARHRAELEIAEAKLTTIDLKAEGFE